VPSFNHQSNRQSQLNKQHIMDTIERVLTSCSSIPEAFHELHSRFPELCAALQSFPPDSAEHARRISDLASQFWTRLAEERREDMKDEEVQNSFVVAQRLRSLIAHLAAMASGDRSLPATVRRALQAPPQAAVLASAEASTPAGAGARVVPELDTHGNPDGDMFDLGVRGGACGAKIIVLCEFLADKDPDVTQQSMRQWQKPLQESKGFGVEVLYLRENGGVFTRRNPSGSASDALQLTTVHLTAAHLQHLLLGASQCWLISGSEEVLSEDCLHVLFDAWATKGVALYILADNEPYVADANRLLHLMELPPLAGNFLGNEVVARRAEHAEKLALEPGFVSSHPIMRGISQLYEGITVAEVDPVHAFALPAHAQPLLYNSRGRITAYAVPPAAGKPQVIVDGGFTRLFFHWDNAGTARFIKNCAAWLAVAMDDAH
jgi:hypothetical protein